MADTLTAPSPPPAAPAAPPAAPPSAPVAPSPQPELHVTPAAVDSGPKPEPPRKGSARDQLFKDLRKKAGEVEPETPPAAPKEGEQAEPPPTDTPPVEGQPPADKKKVSPWKLVDEHKAARAKAEQEIAELRQKMVSPEKAKELEDKYAAVEKRAKELEDHIRFVDYSKSQEFQEKYQKPYEAAWQRWMGELGELQIADASGSERPMQPSDLLELVNMPLQKAREQAEAQFGSFANDVMSARKEIRGLFEAQNKALEEAKKGGSERVAQIQASHQQMQKQIGELWSKFNQEAVADEKLAPMFKPVEGDEEGNKRLTKGYELADKAFSVNPLDPNLTPEQRAEVVRLHAAIRHRAAAFGRLAYQKAQAEQKVAALQAELNKYKESQPGSGEPRREEHSGSTSAHESVFGALRKLAH